MTIEIREFVNGNRQKFQRSCPKIHLVGYLNDSALAHIEENTGLVFTKAYSGLEAQPENYGQIAALLVTYNFKTKYYDNADVKNTIFLKSDHHTGFNVDSICLDCCKHNHIHCAGLSEGDRLAC